MPRLFFADEFGSALFAFSEEGDALITSADGTGAELSFVGIIAGQDDGMYLVAPFQQSEMHKVYVFFGALFREGERSLNQFSVRVQVFDGGDGQDRSVIETIAVKSAAVVLQTVRARIVFENFFDLIQRVLISIGRIVITFCAEIDELGQRTVVPYVGEVGAIVKGEGKNGFQALRQNDLFQGRAFVERERADGLHTLFKDGFGQGSAF